MQNSISDLIKGNVFGFTSRILSPYFARVVQGGGIYEAPQCVETALNSEPLLEQASLALIPSGYKAGTVYSEIPTDGNGDLTFTRSNDTATRVNSAGLIEKVRTNLLLQSNTFDTTWVKGSDTFLTDGFTDPFGESNAWRITMGSGAGTFLNQSLTFSAIPYTFSVWAKANGNTNLTLQISNSPETSYVLTNDWQRISLTFTPTAATAQVIIGNGIITVDALIYGAQLEVGDIATDYIPTTTTAVSVGMTANVPRLDYSGGGCPKLLLEPQRTNLVTFSEQFDNAAWTKINCSITANTTTSPDGTQNADKIIENSVNGAHFVFNVGATISVAQTLSVYAKADTRTQISLQLGANSVLYNLTDGTIISGSGGSIQSVGNGWYRCSITQTPLNTNALIYIANSGSSSYQGNGTSGLFIWGAQLETGAYATSYIPTLGAAVTRGADRVGRSGLGLTNATFVINFRPLNQLVEVLDFQKSGGARMFYIAINSSRFVTFNAVSGGTIGAIGSALTINETCKLAFTLNASTSNIVVFINGLKIGTYATDITTFDGFKELATFGYAQGTKVEQILIFPSVLSDTQAIELTTL